MTRYVVLCAMAGLLWNGTAFAQQAVVLVRHAEKAEAPAGDVALSEAGHRRARALAAVVSGAAIDTVITSQFRRTKETAAPATAVSGLTPVEVTAGTDTEVHARAVAEAVRAGGRAVLVVGHSNTLPAIIRALGGPALAEICEAEYANLFMLVLVPNQPARLVHGYYGAADPPRAGECRKMP